VNIWDSWAYIFTRSQEKWLKMAEKQWFFNILFL